MLSGKMIHHANYCVDDNYAQIQKHANHIRRQIKYDLGTETQIRLGGSRNKHTNIKSSDIDMFINRVVSTKEKRCLSQHSSVGFYWVKVCVFPVIVMVVMVVMSVQVKK